MGKESVLFSKKEPKNFCDFWGPMFQTFTIESAGHLIQVALTPVFLLSGIAALLNVFASRLARVADRLDSLSGGMAGDGCTGPQQAELARLHRRSLALDYAVVLGTIGAALTCLAILTLFLFALSNKVIAGFLVAFFGLAVICTLGSVAAFGLEMLMSSRELRARMQFHVPDLRLWIGRHPKK
jgi:hypothetical protein